MRVFLPGGTGRIGRAVAKVLARGPTISEVAIAARDVALAKRVSAEIGPKAAPVEADALDETTLTQLVEPCDLFVNTAGPDFRVATGYSRRGCRGHTLLLHRGGGARRRRTRSP